MDCVNLLDGFNACGLTLHLPEHQVLAFADAHLGYEDALNRQGFLVPHFQYRDLVKHLDDALELTNPEGIVIAGDLKHEFGSISQQEWAEVGRFLKRLEGYEVKLVKGNHDNILGPIAGREHVEVVQEYRLGTTLFVHGHNPPKNLEGVDTVVIGHEHPAIGLREGERVEKVKCFLKGRWMGKDLIVLPSMNQVTEGTDMLSEPTLSPLLREGVSDFTAYGVEDGKIMGFGRLGELEYLF